MISAGTPYVASARWSSARCVARNARPPSMRLWLDEDRPIVRPRLGFGRARHRVDDAVADAGRGQGRLDAGLGNVEAFRGAADELGTRQAEVADMRRGWGWGRCWRRRRRRCRWHRRGRRHGASGKRERGEASQGASDHRREGITQPETCRKPGFRLRGRSAVDLPTPPQCHHHPESQQQGHRRGTAVAEQRHRHAHYRQQAGDHAAVDQHVDCREKGSS